MSNPAWESDPTTRHEYRWWDGEKWTEYVADDGVQTLDPLTGAENLSPPVQRPESTIHRPAASSDRFAISPDQPAVLAPRAARFGARLIDTIILSALAFIFLLVLHYTDVKPIPIDDLDNSDAYEAYVESLDEVFVALIAITAFYEIALTATRGQTLGKMATRIVVVRADEHSEANRGRPPSWGKSFMRWVLPTVLGLPSIWVPFIGYILWLLCYLSLTWDRDRQGWHDKAAGTLVVTRP